MLSRMMPWKNVLVRNELLVSKHRCLHERVSDTSPACICSSMANVGEHVLPL